MSDYAEDFVRHLTQLRERDRGALAALRHSLGFAPGAYVPAYPAVERFVATDRPAQDAQRQALYLVAGLYALHPRHGATSLAAGFGELMRERQSESIEKRFIALLAADAENLSNYLRQAVSLLAAGEVAIDYAALLDDLSRWLNPYIDPARRDQIRQRWARDFYRALAPQVEASTAESDR